MFAYLGSKARLAHTYQAPHYAVIVEPFAGAAAYSMYWLQQRSDLRCLLIDANPVVVEMWETLLALTPEQLWHYPIPEPGERTLDLVYLATTVSTGSWIRRSKGLDYQITTRMAEKFAGRRRDLAQILSAVRGRVGVRCADYRSVSNLEATWFIDPPYQREGYQYATGNDLDWDRLAAWCEFRRGQVIVCESEGADWMDFKPHATTQTLAGEKSIEVVWYSHPEPTLFSQ